MGLGRMLLLFVVDLDRSNPVLDSDIEDLLHPDADERVIRVTDPAEATMEALAARAGVFPSRNQARKNAFSGPIPHGLAMWGTEAGNFFVWNPGHAAAPPTVSRKRDITAQWWNYLTLMRSTGSIGPWSAPDMDAMRPRWQRRRDAGTWEAPFAEGT